MIARPAQDEPALRPSRVTHLETPLSIRDAVGAGSLSHHGSFKLVSY
jgi:hypothetical protein